MNIELDLTQSDLSLVFGDWLLKTGLWDGRPITWREASDFSKNVARKITRILQSTEEASEKMAHFLAIMGASSTQKPLIAREIFAIRISSSELALLAKGSHKKKKKKHKEESFFQRYKIPIVIGLIATAALAATLALTLLSGGAAAANAVAAGASAINEVIDSDKKSSKPPQSIALSPQESPTYTNPIPNPEIPTQSIIDIQTVSSLYPPEPPKTEESPYAIQYLENGIQIGEQYVTYSDALKWIQDELYLSPQNSPDIDPLAKTAPFPQIIQELRPDPLSGHTEPPKPFTEKKSTLREFFETAAIGFIEPDLLKPHIEPLKQPIFSHKFETNGIQHPQCRIGLINGMQNEKWEAVSSAEHLTRLIGGLNVEATYNSSHGIGGDIAEIFACNYWGNSPNTSKILLETWTDFHTQNKEKPNQKYLQYCHSQGAIHVKNALLRAPQEIRNRIIVVAIAPGDIVPKKMCYDSFNYASKRDIVHLGRMSHSFFFKGGLVSKSFWNAVEEHKELILLDPHPDAPLFDHSWQSPTFIQKIREQAEVYIERDGIYYDAN